MVANMTQKETSLTLSKLTCQVPNYKLTILSLAKVKGEEPFYSEFIENFLAYIPIDYRFLDRRELFGNFAYDAFKFFQERQANKRKLQISSSVIEDNPAINILLLNDNKPFIVDSIICLLTNLNLLAKFLLHPVIACKRDDLGRLQKISDDKELNIKIESLVHISILGNFDQNAINSLEIALNDCLDQVDTTYNIWHKLLSRVTKISQEILDNQQSYEQNKFDYNESIDFLNWLKSDNFTFLGMIDFDVTAKKFFSEDGVKKIWQDVKDEVIDIIEYSENLLQKDQLIILGKINAVSKVHRDNLIDYILVKKINQDGQYDSGSIIFGLYSAVIYYQSVSNIPILRKKLNFVLDKATFPINGYNTKKLKDIVQSLPRELLIQLDQSDLYCMCLYVLSSIMSRKLKLFIQQDWSGTFTNIIIFLPRDRLIPEIHSAINSYLSNIFNGKILSNYIAEVVENISYLFVTIELYAGNSANLEVEVIERELDKISTRWSEDFYDKLCRKFGEYQGGINFKLFNSIFPVEYREKFDGQTALLDIEYLEEATINQRSAFNLIALNKKEFQLKIYSPAPKLTLSQLLPLIENLGFKAIDQQSFSIKQAGNIQESWIFQFTLDSLVLVEGNIDSLKANVEEALDKIACGILKSDSLNKLIVLSNFNWWQVKLVKALTRYLHQTGFIYGKGYVQLTLIKHFLYTKMLVDLFDARFNPKNFSDERVNILQKNIVSYLDSIDNSSEDKVLRSMFNIIKAIVRTNCYQTISDNDPLSKNYFSFKFNPSKIDDLPMPIPFAEIFVYDNSFEAIHLRGGKVARGGIRWSDRGEDYRTEILGLMKAQMTKNSVIVPVGSKGGFFINCTDDNLTHQEYMEKAIQCYKNFLRGLLDITDNIIDGKIIQPKNTIIYDQEDPYLVVAADKGTATFSDYANNVSAEYNFWLGDAFASGGSAGYDHKKMAITAKGAWVSVTNHFQAMGVDPQKDYITVVGIGDMSGDVFGNGMLRSDTIKLVAAFNHKHIFIDPHPDPISSFNERRRLFELPTSNWSDYDLKLISKGGGIFERSSKSIILSPEAKILLKVNVERLTPENLIKIILQADVDLIWNGGIGTYVKASTESNLEIGDKANDNLRINGCDVKAKIIGEGGNIGVSQLARIEYSKNGGRINTDFIDNSAGVDCSDHEVNIKIALNQALSSGKLSFAERNKLLFNMTKQVEELVLIDNYKQNQALDIMQLSPILTVGIFSKFIDSLEEDKLIDRAIEFLPTKEEFSKMVMSKTNITRPELCVILSYSKRLVYHDLMTTIFSQDKYFESYLINYFPKLMQEKFQKEILSHPLKDEIIRTTIVNKIVNQLSGPSLNIIKHETGALVCDIVRSHTIICQIFDLDDLWTQVEFLPSNIDYYVKIEMFVELSKIMRRGISWFLKHLKHPINISDTINEFGESAKLLKKTISSLLLGEAKVKFNNKVERYSSLGVSAILANDIATLDNLISVFDIINVAGKTNSGNMEVANLYFATGNKFSIDWLRRACDKQLNDSYWNRLAIQSIKDDLYEKQRRLLTKIISKSEIIIDLDIWINNNINSANVFLDFIKEIRLQENPELSILILANKKFETFLSKI